MLCLDYFGVALFGIQSLCRYKIRVLRRSGSFNADSETFSWNMLGIFRVRICVCALASNPDLFSKLNQFGNSLHEYANWISLCGIDVTTCMKQEMIQREHKTLTWILLWLCVYTIEISQVLKTIEWNTRRFKCEPFKTGSKLWIRQRRI